MVPILLILQTALTKPSGDLVCKVEGDEITNNNLCIPGDYNKFDLPLPNSINFIDVGIDITDVLRINDKVNIPYNVPSKFCILCSNKCFNSWDQQKHMFPQ